MNTTRRILLASLVTLFGCVLLSALPLHAQAPDLRPELQNITIRQNQTVGAEDVAEGCAAATTRRTLLAFDHYVWNDGTAALNVGAPGCPDCSVSPALSCTNPLFQCSLAGGHNHGHITDFSSYTVTKRGSPDVVVRGHKEGFCLQDSTCTSTPVNPNPGDCSTLSPGCADLYGSGLGCQYVDITSLRPGKYTLRVELNPTRNLTEASFDNNVAMYDFEVCNARHHSANIKIGVGAPPTGKRPITVRATFEFRSEREVKSFDPLKTGLSVGVTLGQSLVFGQTSVAIPAGKVGQGCYPVDGWKKTGRSKWEYRTDSELDSDCRYNVTSGIRNISIEREGRFIFMTIRGRLDPSAVAKNSTGGFVSMSWLGSPIDASNDTCSPSAPVKGCAQSGPGNNVIVCK